MIQLRDSGISFKMDGCFKSMGLKVNLGKIKVMFSSGITQDGMSMVNIDPCRVCSLRAKAISFLCMQCGSGSTIDVPE